MNFKALDRGEGVAVVGEVLPGISLFLGGYSSANRDAMLARSHGSKWTGTGWPGVR